MEFKLEATSGGARAATLKMAHGEVQTPVFMPVGNPGYRKSPRCKRYVKPWGTDNTGEHLPPSTLGPDQSW